MGKKRPAGKITKQTAKRRYLSFAFDWDSTGFFPWRIPFLMFIIGLGGILFFSSFSIDIDDGRYHDKYPESVLLINRDQFNRMTSGKKIMPFTRRGPIWADPVSGGLEGDLFFKLHAGLSRQSSLMPLESMARPGASRSFVNHLPVAPVFVEGWLDPAFDLQQARIAYHPVIDPINIELEDSYTDRPIPPSSIDQRGMATTFWVDVNEWGGVTSVLQLESSGNNETDREAEAVIRRLKWLPRHDGRKGMITIDWEGRTADAHDL